MKLTQENYFSREAGMAYMSVSQFKAFAKCETAALAELNGEYICPTSTALLVGSYVDAFFEGTLAAFQSAHREIFRRDGALKSEYQQAQQIIERIQRDKLFMAYMSGKKQEIMTGIIAGVQVKIKVDSLLPDKIVDLKVMRDFLPVYVADRGKIPWFAAWGYDLQGAVYQEIVRQNIGEKLPFYLAAATKEQTINMDIVHIAQEELDNALMRFIRDAPRFDAIKQGIIEPTACGCCDFCKATKRLVEPTESIEYWEDF